MENAKDNVIQLFPKRRIPLHELRKASDDIDDMNGFLRFLINERIPTPSGVSKLLACRHMALSISFHAWDAFATLELPDRLTPAMVAELYATTVKSLAKDRKNKTGLPYTTIGRKIYYDRVTVLRSLWLNSGFDPRIVNEAVK